MSTPAASHRDAHRPQLVVSTASQDSIQSSEKSRRTSLRSLRSTHLSLSRIFHRHQHQHDDLGLHSRATHARSPFTSDYRRNFLGTPLDESAKRREVKRKLERLELIQAQATQYDQPQFRRDRLLVLNVVVSIGCLIALSICDWDPGDRAQARVALCEWPTDPDVCNPAASVAVAGRLVENTTTFVLKLLQSVLTAILLAQLIELHYFEYGVHIVRDGMRETPSIGGYLSSSCFAAALAQCLLLGWHTPPGVSAQYDNITLLVWLRAVLLIRLAPGFSEVYVNRSNIIRVCMDKQYPVPNFDSAFILQWLFQRRGLSLMVFLSSASMLIFSHVMWVAERGQPESQFDFETCVWLVSVSMTTVGFGDFVPISYIGRMIAIIAAVFGILLSSIAVAIISQLLEPASYQKHAIDYMLKTKAANAEKESVVKFVQTLCLHKLSANRKLAKSLARRGGSVEAVLEERRETDGSLRLREMDYSYSKAMSNAAIQLRRSNRNRIRTDHQMGFVDPGVVELQSAMQDLTASMTSLHRLVEEAVASPSKTNSPRRSVIRDSPSRSGFNSPDSSFGSVPPDERFKFVKMVSQHESSASGITGEEKGIMSWMRNFFWWPHVPVAAKGEPTKTKVARLARKPTL